jgi:hypothetical protein
VFRPVAQKVSTLGDVAVMLKLPESQTIFTPQETTIHAVHDEADEPWESDPKADVLLLGDSFTNVFSMEPMGWGTAAGLGPQLARSRAWGRRHRAERLRRIRYAGGSRPRDRRRRRPFGGKESRHLGVRFARAFGGRLEAHRLDRGRRRQGGAPMTRTPGRRALVTGAAGVMGVRLVRALIEAHWDVRALVLPGDPLSFRLRDLACEIREGDVSDARSLARLCDGVDTVYHLAAVIL